MTSADVETVRSRVAALVAGGETPVPSVYSDPDTEPSTTGGRRLSAGFTEWMMGLPHGWVTAVPGVSRSRQLRLLGNGVVPQQAAYAIRALAGWGLVS